VLRLLQILCLLLVAVAMGLSLAHALELPGKMRLGKDAYLSVQTIYYPGFTIGGGVGEVGGMLALIALLVLMPHAGARFWWTAAAFAFLLAAHLTYWLVTHPVNNFWLKDVDVTGFGAGFFSLFAGDPGGDWSKLRNIWEYSHVGRAVFAMLSLISLALSLTV
jgi:hypothetical protein